MVEDQQLTEHFRLYDFLQTTHADLAALNHQIDDIQIGKLRNVAMLYEVAWGIIELPWTITSGYRCPALNAAVGSSLKSQHLLCEAGDAVPKGIGVLDAFKTLRQAAKDKRISFGQMIYEKANRGYSGGIVEWVHLSLGSPYRAPEKCGQILTMADGSYSLLEQITSD